MCRTRHEMLIGTHRINEFIGDLAHTETKARRLPGGRQYIRSHIFLFFPSATVGRRLPRALLRALNPEATLTLQSIHGWALP